jgi:Arc/MetJ-type ribon-helix-helix transcriptional regulator
MMLCYDIFILNYHTFMTTLSVPLTPELAKFIEEATKSSGLTKSDIMRQALTFYAEEQAVRKVLNAASEPTLKGNLKDLMNKL